MIGFITKFIAGKAAAFLGSKFSGWVAVFGMLTLVATLAAGWFYVAALRADKATLEQKNEALELRREQTALQLQACVKQHVVNQEVIHDFQNLLRIDRERLDALRLRIPAGNRACVPV